MREGRRGREKERRKERKKERDKKRERSKKRERESDRKKKRESNRKRERKSKRQRKRKREWERMISLSIPGDVHGAKLFPSRARYREFKPQSDMGGGRPRHVHRLHRS